MVKIKLSQLAGRMSVPDFAKAVEDHARELGWHRDHHTAIASGEERDPYPAPVASELVDAAVRRPDLIPDYEIEDDLTPTLEHKRMLVVHRLVEAEAAAIDAIRPRLKHRLDEILYREAMAKILPPDPDDGVDGKVEDGRSEAEKAMCEEHEERHRRFAAVHKHAAKVQSDVADIPAEEIDAWAIPPFP